MSIEQIRHIASLAYVMPMQIDVDQQEHSPTPLPAQNHPTSRQPRPCSVNGVPFEGIKHAASAYGMSPPAARRRFTSMDWPDWVCPSLSKLVVQKRKDRSVIIHGEKFKTISAACVAHGVNYSTAKKRLDNTEFADWVWGS